MLYRIIYVYTYTNIYIYMCVCMSYTHLYYIYIILITVIFFRDIHTHAHTHIYIYIHMYTYTFTFTLYIYANVYTSFNPQHAAPGKLHEAIVFSFSHILPESRLRHTHRIYSRHLEHFLSQEQQQQWAEEKMQLQKDRKWSHWKTLQLPVLFVRTCGFNRKQLQVLTSRMK